MVWEKFNKTEEIDNFTKGCLLNESMYDYKGSIEIIKKYWKKAKTVDEFKELVKNDERLENNQGYWQLFKNDNSLIIKYLNKKADKKITTISDIGCLKVGNEDFAYCIPNGYGDGVNQVYIFEENLNIHCLNFVTTMIGKDFGIYETDCGNKIATKLTGRYALYSSEKIFALVKWEE